MNDKLVVGPLVILIAAMFLLFHPSAKLECGSNAIQCTARNTGEVDWDPEALNPPLTVDGALTGMVRVDAITALIVCLARLGKRASQSHIQQLQIFSCESQ
ncbi:MAG TPA: hypothetical protein VG498_26710 [Terriglobales bacterium]|nr:hypothetical protein [Terriglobales bacterium]